ncbi:MAG TPA: DNA polymerase Y family protein [Steroidobacteraceae bacterium]
MPARPQRPTPGSAPLTRSTRRVVSRTALRIEQQRALPLLEPRELWIGAHLPQLALEALVQLEEEARVLEPHAPPQPLAVAELQGSAQCIVAASEQAASAGVRAGMSLAAALALAPQLAVRTRDPRREQMLLERLARHALAFTPRVSLAPPDGLLLEVKGSLQLFGGATKLGTAFLRACRVAGVQPKLALAPTPLAALAGARYAAWAVPRAGDEGPVPASSRFKVADESRLVGALAPLPLAVLRWPAQVLERLAKVGVRTIGEVLRLPRAGFARRFGAEALASLDRLTGRAPDPRRSFEAPERFRMRRGCTYDLEHHEAILAALTPFFETLAKFLEARQCAITELECRLWHRHAPPTRCVLNLAAPAADGASLQALLGERLAALALPEPVRSFELRSGRLVPRALHAESLWRPGEHGGSGAGAQSVDLIEMLRARLGNDAVYGLAIHATHRPEAASRRVEAAAAEQRSRSPRSASRLAGSAQPWPAFRRPLWLLPEPEPLPESGGLPRRRGPLHLLGEPERIETGWWEGAQACAAGVRSREVARDYYQAVDSRGVRLWIFRERLMPHRWFLQGVFG